MRAVWIALAYFFCVLAAYYVVRPIRDQLSAAVGSTALPIFYTATFVATLSLTPVFGALVARFPRRVFVPIVYAFFIVGMMSLATSRPSSVAWYLAIADGTDGFSPRSTAAALAFDSAVIAYE